MALCYALEDCGLTFTFAWYPGYVVIEGNEDPDAAARNGAESPRVDEIAIWPDAKLTATSTIINV